MRRPILLFAVFLAALVVSPSEAESDRLSWKAWGRLKQDVEDTFASGASIEEKAAIAAEVAADGQPRAAKLLLRLADEIVERECSALSEVVALSQAIPRGGKHWAKEIAPDFARLLNSAAADRALGMKLADAMAEGPEALRVQIIEAARKRKDKKLHRLVVRMAAHDAKNPATRSFVMEALVGDDDPRIRVAALRALNVNAKAWSDWIADRIADEDWTVQIAAAHMSAQNGVGESIGEMIKLMSCAAPRVKHAFVGSLQVLTKKSIGMDPARWKFWWKREQKNYGVTARPAEGPICVDGAYVPFYDLEIHSDRVLFVIDVSDSMLNTAVLRIEKGREILGKFSRIELVKRQLVRSIRGLSEGTRFNIVAFGGEVDPWRTKMAVADKKSRLAAIKWIKKLKPDGATMMNGVLHWAFGQMGFGDSSVAEIPADTLVVLSDGTPTDGWPGGRGDESRLRVLENVQRWNREHAVVIHTVALKGANQAFLKALAKENGGQCSVR